MQQRRQGWVPREVTPEGKKVPALFRGRPSAAHTDSRKYFASRSMCKTPGLDISPRAIFSRVLRGTPLPEETVGQEPLVDFRPRKTKSKIESVMAEHANPRCGVTQPGNGLGSRVAYSSMGRPRKQPRPVRTPKDVIGEILASNVRRLMCAVYRDREHETAQIEALANSSGISKETIRRILARDVSPRIDNVQMLAIALGATAGDLLQPKKGVDQMTTAEKQRA